MGRGQSQCSLFMKWLRQWLGSHATTGDLIELGAENIPQYDPYEDNVHNAEIFPILGEEPEVTLEWGGPICKCRDITPKRRQNGQWPSGTWKQDANGNPIGGSNQNLILNMCLYEVEFSGGEITELAANIIAELMYAQCDVHRKE